jgi:predicted GNAT family acetyltransferase
MSITVMHDAKAGRFHAHVDGQTCELDYALQDGVMSILHTVVPAAVGGRGIAAELVRAALAYAKAQAWKVIPRCSYAAAYIQRHHEYADLLA